MKWKNNHITSIGVDFYNNIIDLNGSDDLSRVALGEKEFVPIGYGSNIIVWDDCTLLRVVPQIALEGPKGSLLRVSAGVILDSLIKTILKCNKHHPIQYLSGIPGSVGGAVFQNSGAYNHTISEFVVEVVCWDCHFHQKVILTREQCNFGHRSSVFVEDPQRYIILYAYIDVCEKVINVLNENNYKTIIERRIAKFPDPYAEPNSGALFMPTFIPHDDMRIGLLQHRGVELFHDGDFFKIPSGRLIELCGLKGKHITTSLYLSPLHANFLCRSGKATPEEWFEAVSIVKETVEHQFGIALRPEVNVVGRNIPAYVKELCRTKEVVKI